MKGGKKTCNRTGKKRNNCHVLSCVDYEAGRFNSFEELDCSEINQQKSPQKSPNKTQKYRNDRSRSLSIERVARGRSNGRTRSLSNGSIKSVSNNTTRGRSNGRTRSQSKSHTDWEEFWDVNADTNYYYNHKTGEANWVKPEGKYKKLQKNK